MTRLEQAAAGTNYPPDAFRFVLHGIHALQLNQSDPNRHVTAADLCWRLRDLALLKFGPRAFDQLRSWNVFACEDLGSIVYRMIEFDLMRKSPADSQEEFNGVFLFEEAFAEGSHPDWQPPRPIRFGLASLFVLITVSAIILAGISREGLPGAIVTVSAAWIGLIGASLTYFSLKPWGRGSILGVTMGLALVAGALFLFLGIII